MSMILDALKRSREDSRSGGGVPSVDAEHFVPMNQATLPGWVFIAGAVGVLVIVVLLALLLLRSSDTPTVGGQSSSTTTPTTVTNPVGSSVAASGSPSVVATPTVTTPTITNPTTTTPVASASGDRVAPVSSRDRADRASAQELSSVTDRALSTGNGLPANIESASTDEPAAAVAALYSQTAESQIAAATSSDTSAKGSASEPAVIAANASSKQSSTPSSQSGAASPESSRPSKVAKAPADTGVSADQKAEEELIDVEAVLRKAQRELGESALTPHPTPLLDSLSQQQKDKVPTVLYTGHDFNPGGESAVVLNGDRLAVGQRSKGFLVKEILSDSVVLSWGGIDFRLRALNSWVNL